jgi:hypothetical protein
MKMALACALAITSVTAVAAQPLQRLVLKLLAMLSICIVVGPLLRRPSQPSSLSSPPASAFCAC